MVDHFTLSRDHPLEDRLAAVAAAGAHGVGLYLGEIERLMGLGLTLDRLEQLLDANDLALVDIEVVKALQSSGPGAEQAARFERLAWELADRFGCRYLQAVGPFDGTADDAAERFAGLCDRADEHGLIVGLEPLPFTNVGHLADVLHIVRLAARSNGGVCLDLWHHTRGGEGRVALEDLRPGDIKAVQMCDGPLVPALDDYYTDCLTNRVPPGQGEMDAAGFVATAIRLGSTAPWSLEVCDARAVGAAGTDHVARSVAAMQTVLAAAQGAD